MNKCCDDFPNGLFRHVGRGKYRCCVCGANVSINVLEMYLKDPWGTLKLKRNGRFCDNEAGGSL